jgi:hypothetical protein
MRYDNANSRGNSTARPLHAGDAPCFYGVVGALLRGSRRCMSRAALSSALTCRQRGHQGAIHYSQPPLGRLCERITAGRPIICLATLNTTSYTFPTGCRQQLLQQPCQNNANSLIRRYRSGDALVSNCTVGPMLKREENTAATRKCALSC